MCDAMCYSFLKVYIYLYSVTVYMMLLTVLFDLLVVVALNVLCVWVGHHSRSLWVFSRRQLCCYLGCGVCFEQLILTARRLFFSNGSTTLPWALASYFSF
jgi:hypothetical protein